jgi:hypothetical protein
VNWAPVDSSVFTSAAYLHGKRLLYLRFHSGDIYRYLDFPPDQYDESVAADSKGEYFAYNIRDKFAISRFARPKHLQQVLAEFAVLQPGPALRATVSP